MSAFKRYSATILLSSLIACLPGLCKAEIKEAVEQAMSLRDQGDFAKASELLNSTLEQTSMTQTAEERDVLRFEVERINRIRADYKRSRAEVMEKIRTSVPDFSDEELDNSEREGELDTMTIDGQKYYVNSTASNLFKRKANLRARRTTATLSAGSPLYTNTYDEMVKTEEAAKATSATLLRPHDVLVTYTLIVHPNAAPAGEKVCAWLPVPRIQPNQSDFVLLHTSPPEYVLAPHEAPQRTVSMETVAQEGQPTTFTATYAYRSWTRSFKPSPDKVMPYDKSTPEYQYYTASRPPHLDTNNEYLRSINTEIVGDATNPLIVAKRIFDWVGNNMIYQFAREYSTIDNLSLYTAKRRGGDCGQHAMFFIAMCRINGIPARWSTGWYWADGWNAPGLHDWTEIYVEPWGWMPCDPDVALLAKRNSDDALTTDQKNAVSDWLFGNQDAWRMTVNCDYGRTLYPPKNDFRSETVDFQRGEVESNGKNLYFDKWDYGMQVAPLPDGELDKLIRK